MKKRYIIHDEDGKEFKVEETVDETPCEEVVEEEVHDEDVYLTSEEIEALKALIPYKDKLIALVSETTDSDEECEDEEEEEIEETEEEVIDTDEEDGNDRGGYPTAKPPRRDSRASFNAIETKKKRANDSIDDAEDVNSAWAARYNRG